MKALKKWTAFMMIITMCTIFLTPAMASVTSVKPLGDGGVEIRWDDSKASRLLIVPKMTEDFSKDIDNYGYYWWDISGMKKTANYYFAPGQSYWVLTEWNDGTQTYPYAYKAARAGNFTEWRGAPSFGTFQLKERDMDGKEHKVSYFTGSELENQNSYTTHGINWKLNYPQLKKSRTYIWQFVIVEPNGIRWVHHAGELTLPAGRSFANDPFMPMDDFFSSLYDMRGEIPLGTYTMSIYWSTQLACSSTFRVR